MTQGLSEKTWVRLGGLDQGMVIKSRDLRNPVLLYLHGGMPDYFLTERYPTGLEGLFTVVWWEQRGSGLLYHRGLDPDTVTPERMMEDALELADHLRERFGRDRVYLMGHSGGTFLGIKLVVGRGLWNTQLATDLTALVSRVEVPVYFLHGVHDYTVA